MCKPSFYLTCLALLFAVGTRVQAAKPFQQDGGADGMISMEAEHFDENIAKGTVKWVEVGPTGGFTGVKGMQCNGAGVIKTGYAASSPSLGYQINFVTTGTHYVWVRAYRRHGQRRFLPRGPGRQGDPDRRMDERLERRLRVVQQSLRRAGYA